MNLIDKLKVKTHREILYNILYKFEYSRYKERNTVRYLQKVRELYIYIYRINIFEYRIGNRIPRGVLCHCQECSPRHL